MTNANSNKPTDLPPYSGFVLTFEPARTRWLQERLGMTFSDSFSALDFKFQHRELVLLVLDRDPLSISGIALMERMHGSGGSGKLKMRISDVVAVGPPLADTKLTNIDLAALVSTPETITRTNPEIWKKLLSQLVHLRPTIAGEVNALMAKRDEKRVILGESPKITRLNEQRDALGLSLDIAQLDRSSVMKAINAENVESAKSVLDLLDTMPVQERSLLEHDRAIMKDILKTKYRRSALFEKGSGRGVRVYLADKTPLETVIGIDLLIYQECYDTFLLLQYKAMEKKGSDWQYHLDTKVDQQLACMAKTRAAIRKRLLKRPNLWSYRLNDEPFYFKFCERTPRESREEGLVPGITMSESHLREFLTLPEACGPKGGLYVGYSNSPRYLSNTEFVQLASSGWIGSGQEGTSLIKRILKANKAGGRQAMFAVIKSPRSESASGRGRIRH